MGMSLHTLLSKSSHLIEILMLLIREIAHQALSTGLLTREAENQLRHLLQHTKYEQEDFRAFMQLQTAAMLGSVKQESRLEVCHQN